MGKARIFGTDGIRGRAGEGWLSSDGASSVGRALAAVLTRRGALKAARGRGTHVLLGHDGRRSGPELETALARGLAAHGLASTSAGLITTPGLALLARLEGFQLAVMISASHNPAEDNGIKVFTGAGEKLSDELELEVEAALAADPHPVTAGPAPVEDPTLEADYIAYLVEKAGAGLDLGGLPLVVDCANGGSSRVAPRVFVRLGARVTAIGAAPDGDNINRACGATSPAALQAEVRRTGARIGVALDGDGDRCILVDERGEIVHGDGILTVLARHLRAKGELEPPRIVATVMANRGLHRALREVGVSVETVDVGDKNVVDGLKRLGLRLGGEQSGHILFGADHFFIGDGVYTALRVLAVLNETKKSLSELAAPYRPFPQVLVNVPVKSKPPLAGMPAVAEAVKRVEDELAGDGRVLLRYSGTEPLARLMIEGPDAAMIQARAQAVAALIRAEIGA
ncbi:MAG: phosphoglucosamine mutase [Planctomycetes bacterium]|nr:phosphoglucosamine mutase [Planctomycetota bacterium]